MPYDNQKNLVFAKQHYFCSLHPLSSENTRNLLHAEETALSAQGAGVIHTNKDVSPRVKPCRVANTREVTATRTDPGVHCCIISSTHFSFIIASCLLHHRKSHQVGFEAGCETNRLCISVSALHKAH